MNDFLLFVTGPIPGPVLPTTYDPFLVVLSYLVAALAAYTAIDLAGRVSEFRSEPGRAFSWLAGGAFALGAGIWSMHFVAMLAFKLPIPVRYELWTTLASMVAAIVTSGFALYIVTRGTLSWQRLLIGGAVMGAGIGAMHYTGMAAMRLDALVMYYIGPWLLSVANAIVCSTVALWLVFHSGSAGWLRKLLAALVMGVAIVSMHYTGMYATVCVATATGQTATAALGIDPVPLAAAIAVVTLLVMALALTVSLQSQLMSRSLRQQNDRLKREIELRRRVEAELQHHRDHLQKLVDERTAELSERNAALDREVADRKCAEEEAHVAREAAESASRYKSEFLATMSHEIRTPMNGVVGMIDVLHQSSLRGDQVEMVKLIRESAFSLLGIIEDILDFSKIEAGKLELEQDPIVVADVVEGVCNLLDGLANRSDAIFMLYIDPEIPAQVLGDALRLRQVLINIANNAIKFSSGQARSGRVSLRVSLVEQRAEQVTVEFRVIDNGIGMDKETQARLFTAFTQADASTTRRFGGTGLGLAIAHNLVTLMDGTITVQSAPDAGSTFIVRLPFTPLPPELDVIEEASKVAELSCIVVGVSGGFADDLATYLKHANASVARAPDLVNAGTQSVGRSGLLVWIIDAGDERRLLAKIHAARARIPRDVHLVVVLIERGRRRRIRLVAPDILMVDGNFLHYSTFLKAVAVAAGRASLEAEAGAPASGKLVAVAPSREEALRQGKLILIAEDYEANQKVIVRQLALLGFAADVAADGRLALERWKSGDYALLLTDLHMPEMDGYQLTQAIRAEEKGKRRIPIIALTANALKGEAEHCHAVGMDDYRSKPAPLAELKSVLSKWLPPVAEPEVDVITLSTQSPAVAQPTSVVNSLDVSVLKGLVGDDPDTVKEFLHDFRVSAAKIAAELRAAFAAGQTKAVVASAHKLKSSARAVGAFAFGKVCETIEQAGKAGDADVLAVLLPRFETELAGVEDQLAKSFATGDTD